MNVRAALIVSLSLCGAASAQDLSPEQVAKIRVEQKDAMKKIDAAHGNKKAGEMSNDERRQVMEEQKAAEEAVLQQAGVDARSYTNYTLRMDKEERKQVEAAEKKLEAEAAAKKKAAEEAQKKAESGGDEVQIQKGFDEKNPVDLEGGPKNGEPVIEYGGEAAGQGRDDE